MPEKFEIGVDYKGLSERLYSRISDLENREKIWLGLVNTVLRISGNYRPFADDSDKPKFEEIEKLIVDTMKGMGYEVTQDTANPGA